jgi:hypothetical protein
MRRARSLAVLLLSFAVTAPFVATAFAPPAEAGRRAPLRLTPNAVVPGPGDLAASGTFSWNAGRDGFCFLATADNLDSFIQRIAIHRGGVGTTGPEVIRLSPSSIGIFELRGCAPADRELLREIGRSPADFYMLVTTVNYPGGAMRGQLRQ